MISIIKYFVSLIKKKLKRIILFIVFLFGTIIVYDTFISNGNLPLAIMSGRTQLGIVGNNFFDFPKLNKNNVFLDENIFLVNFSIIYTKDTKDKKILLKIPIKNSDSIRIAFNTLVDYKYNDNYHWVTINNGNKKHKYLEFGLDFKPELLNYDRVINLWFFYKVSNKDDINFYSNENNYFFTNDKGKNIHIAKTLYIKQKINSLHTKIIELIYNSKLLILLIIVLVVFGVVFILKLKRHYSSIFKISFKKKALPLVFSFISFSFSVYNSMKDSELKFDIIKHPIITVPKSPIYTKYRVSLSDDIVIYSFDKSGGINFKDSITINKNSGTLKALYGSDFTYIEKFEIIPKNGYRIPNINILSNNTEAIKYFSDLMIRDKKHRFVSDTIININGLTKSYFFSIFTKEPIIYDDIEFHTEKRVYLATHKYVTILVNNRIDEFFTKRISESMIIQFIILILIHLGLYFLISYMVKNIKLLPTKNIVHLADSAKIQDDSNK